MEFRSLQEAFEVYKNTAPGEEARIQASIYLNLHMPPAMKERMYALLHEIYPQVKPDWYDAAGQPVYKLNTVMAGLGIPETDRERVIEMLESMPGALVPDGHKLYRRQ